MYFELKRKIWKNYDMWILFNAFKCFIQGFKCSLVCHGIFIPNIDVSLLHSPGLCGSSLDVANWGFIEVESNGNFKVLCVLRPRCKGIAVIPDDATFRATFLLSFTADKRRLFTKVYQYIQVHARRKSLHYFCWCYEETSATCAVGLGSTGAHFLNTLPRFFYVLLWFSQTFFVDLSRFSIWI